MATQAQIVADIRARIGESTMTDDEVYALYIEKGGVNCAAAEVWARKAGAAGDFIDISEGSSTRKLSQVAEQAQRMANFYGGLCALETGDGPNRRTRTRQIVRP